MGTSTLKRLWNALSFDDRRWLAATFGRLICGPLGHDWSHTGSKNHKYWFCFRCMTMGPDAPYGFDRMVIGPKPCARMQPHEYREWVTAVREVETRWMVPNMCKDCRTQLGQYWPNGQRVRL